MTFSRCVIFILAICFLSVGFVGTAGAGKKKQRKRFLKCIEVGEDRCSQALDKCPEKYHRECIGKFQTGEIEKYADFVKLVERKQRTCWKRQEKCMQQMLDDCLQIVK